MKNSFSLQQIQKKTNNLDADLISRQYKLNLMVYFFEGQIRKSKIEAI